MANLNWIQKILGRFGTNTDAAGTTTVFARLKQIVDTYLADGTHGLAALEALIDNLEPSQFAYAGTVTGVAAAPKFQCSGLVGHGNDYFKGFWAYVVWDAAGGGAQPQGQILECTGYDSAGGDFTVAPFAPNVIAVGDKVLLIHPSLAYMLNLTPTRADYLDELDFDLQGTLATMLDMGGLGKGLVTKALTFADNTGQVNLFTVTGDVLVRLVAVVKTTCGIVGGGTNVSVGTAAIVDAIIPVTDITLLVAQEIWHDAAPDSEIESLATIREYIISDGNDITLNSSAADNSGAITFYCFWTPLSSGATVVAA